VWIPWCEFPFKLICIDSGTELLGINYPYYLRLINNN
jgi:hypothetical protein